MATVVLFHSTQGLRPAVGEAADRLRTEGHEVHAPDLFDGHTFDTVDDGIVFRDELGLNTIIARSQAALAELPDELVFAGFSMGAAAAMYSAATRQGAVAAIPIHGAMGLDELGIERWPSIPVQAHYAEADPWVPEGQRASMARMVRGAGAEFTEFVYPGEGHLFDVRGMPEFDSESTELLWERVLGFLAYLAQ